MATKKRKSTKKRKKRKPLTAAQKAKLRQRSKLAKQIRGKGECWGNAMKRAAKRVG